jgi:hypothetical protein
MSLRLNKKALTGWEQVLALILIILALAAIFLLIFKADILTKISNLPSYGSSSTGVDIKIDVQTTDSSCKVKVGNVQGDYMTKQGDINFCQDIIKQENCNGNLYSGLKLDSKDVQRDVTWWPIDKKVGSFTNGKITLDVGLFDKNSEEFKKLAETYKFADLQMLLKNLDGAVVIGNSICRDKLIQ